MQKQGEGRMEWLEGVPSRTILLPDSSNSSHYVFLNRWTIDGTVAEVEAILLEPGRTTEWWGAAHSASEELEGGDGNGLGRVIRFVAHGWLPYSLQYLFRVSEVSPGNGFTMEAAGDFRGTAECRYVEAGEGRVTLDFFWTVEVAHPFVSRFSFLLRPLFASNHFWVMKRGREGLQLEVSRRRGDPSDRPFPAAAFPHCLESRRRAVRWKPWAASWALASERTG